MSLLDFFKQKSPVAAADEDTNRRDVQGRTALHDAVSSVRFEGSEDKADLPLADALLKAGADPNARDNEGRTPLHLAQDADAAVLLIGAGADIEAKDNFGHRVTEGKAGAFTQTIEDALNALIPENHPNWANTMDAELSRQYEEDRRDAAGWNDNNDEPEQDYEPEHEEPQVTKQFAEPIENHRGWAGTMDAELSRQYEEDRRDAAGWNDNNDEPEQDYEPEHEEPQVTKQFAEPIENHRGWAGTMDAELSRQYEEDRRDAAGWNDNNDEPEQDYEPEHEEPQVTKQFAEPIENHRGWAGTMDAELSRQYEEDRRDAAGWNDNNDEPEQDYEPEHEEPQVTKQFAEPIENHRGWAGTMDAQLSRQYEEDRRDAAEMGWNDNNDEPEQDYEPEHEEPKVAQTEQEGPKSAPSEAVTVAPEPKVPSLDELYAALDNPEPMAPRADKPRTKR